MPPNAAAIIHSPSMLSQVTDSYIHHNAPLANVAWADDAEWDTIYANMFSASASHDEQEN